MRLAWLVLAIGGCYSPHAVPGAACSPDGSCPDDLVCTPSGTCETAIVDASGSGDDGDPTGCAPANDRAAGATDVSAGGVFPSDLSCAHGDDPGDFGCSGGADVFYSIQLTAEETIYFDTIASMVPTELRIYPGSACDAAKHSFSCSFGACGTRGAQTAQTLPAGPSCIVVAQQQANDPVGPVALRVIHGGRTGDAFAGAKITDTTCNGTSQTRSSCVDTSGVAKDLGYYVLLCPGDAAIDASTCDANTFDDNVYVVQAPATEVACYDDGAACIANPNAAVVTGAKVAGPGLAWVVVDGFGATCGPFTLTVTVH